MQGRPSSLVAMSLINTGKLMDVNKLRANKDMLHPTELDLDSVKDIT